MFESEGESDADGGTATATRSDGGGLSLAIGYGLVFGRAETKAIAMTRARPLPGARDNVHDDEEMRRC